MIRHAVKPSRGLKRGQRERERGTAFMSSAACESGPERASRPALGCVAAERQMYGTAQRTNRGTQTRTK